MPKYHRISWSACALQPEDATQLFNWVLAVLQQYARNGRRAHAGTSHRLNARLQEDANGEAEAELRALLRLLSNVTQRDLVDFGTPSGQPGVDVAQVSTSLRSPDSFCWTPLHTFC